MKIYHTETQADYDALMIELEKKGIVTLEKHRWKNHRHETVVFVHAIDKNHNSSRTDTTYSDINWSLYKYPDTPITKYKAEGEKMRFTKENVYKMVERYRSDFDYLIGDLKSDIFNLDDKPEKVVVPKFVAEFYESIRDNILSEKFKAFEITTHEDVSKWYMDFKGRHNNNRTNAQETIAKMDLYGYTIEPEQLYYIPLPHLETSDGIQQVLSKRKNDTHYFAYHPIDKFKQRYTKEELEQVPEIYKPFAKPIEEEEE